MWLDDRERNEESLRQLRLAMVSGGATAAEVFPELFAPEELQLDEGGPVDFARLQQVEEYTESQAMDDFAKLTRTMMANDTVTLREGPDDFLAGALMSGNDDSREWV